ncbi:MAG: AMP-binding protein [Bacteroidia bacterium]|nr:AMP-binding protein [Bacteroidia bacterium]MCX7652922.1 AMP-binding protein [Bacteroidia bacterium]MDW8416610.1 AMP-binding protein [Bacteroidia bacterium]
MQMENPTSDQIQAWCAACRHSTLSGEDFSRHIRLYEQIFGKEPIPPFFPLWYPQYMGNVQQTNLYQTIQLWREKLVKNTSVAPSGDLPEELYAAFHRWSVEHRADFWRYVIFDRLNIPFQHPPETILSFPKGNIEQPKWLDGAAWNVIEVLLRQPPEHTALIYERENGESQKWNYGDLITYIKRTAGALYAQGLREGDRIALCLPMRPEAIFLYLGALYAGISVATIPDSLSGEEISARLRIAKPKLLFIQDGLHREGKFIPLYERLQAHPLPPTIVLPGKEAIQTRLRNNASTWMQFISDSQSLSQPYYGPSDKEIGVLFSSGTTAEPKAIPWTQLTAIKALADAYFYHDVHPTDTITWHTNLGWMMGPWLLFAGFGHGATIALYEGPPTSPSYCKFIERQSITILGVVPSLVRRWIETDAWKEADWSQIRLFSSTGEASNPWHMWRLMAKANYKPIIEYCGGTEIGGGYITSTLIHPNAPSQFCVPALGIDFILLNEMNQPDTEGELFLLPPSIGLSQTLLNADHHKVYYQDTPPIQEGWKGASDAPISLTYEGVRMHLRRHGDYMRRLPSGRWSSGGRADDAMNLGGIKVSAAEIERVVAQVPGVGEAAAIAVPPPEGGPERLILYIVQAQGTSREPEEWQTLLSQQIREKLSPLFHLHAVEIVSELPRTASNKVMRRLLRTQYLEAIQKGK